MPALLAACLLLGTSVLSVGARKGVHGQRHLAVVVPVPFRGDVDLDLAVSPRKLRTVRCPPLLAQEKVDLVLYHASGENEKDRQISGVADSIADSPAGRRFSGVRTVYDQAVSAGANQVSLGILVGVSQGTQL